MQTGENFVTEGGVGGGVAGGTGDGGAGHAAGGVQPDTGGDIEGGGFGFFVVAEGLDDGALDLGGIAAEFRTLAAFPCAGASNHAAAAAFGEAEGVWAVALEVRAHRGGFGCGLRFGLGNLLGCEFFLFHRVGLGRLLLGWRRRWWRGRWWRRRRQGNHDRAGGFFLRSRFWCANEVNAQRNDENATKDDLDFVLRKETWLVVFFVGHGLGLLGRLGGKADLLDVEASEHIEDFHDHHVLRGAVATDDDGELGHLGFVLIELGLEFGDGHRHGVEEELALVVDGDGFSLGAAESRGLAAFREIDFHSLDSGCGHDDKNQQKHEVEVYHRGHIDVVEGFVVASVHNWLFAFDEAVHDGGILIAFGFLVAGGLFWGADLANGNREGRISWGGVEFGDLGDELVDEYLHG